MKSFAVLILSLCLFPIGAQAAPKFKKISMKDSNNAPFFLYSGEGVFQKRDLSYLRELKTYVEAHGFPKDERSGEFEFAVEALKWVSMQWSHDGMNEAPKGAKALEVLQNVYDKKVSYRCVEYGLVLADVLEAYGFITRSIALRAPDLAYGTPGRGHVASEVWINSLGKWVFLDGQFGVYMTAQNSSVPLNYYEVFKEKEAGRWGSLAFHFLKPSKMLEQDTKDYKAFLSGYFGFISVSNGETEAPRISLYLDLKTPTITFQGLPMDDVIFTDNVKIVYPDMNRVSVLLKYKDKGSDFQAMFKKLDIKSDEDYKKNMGSFAATPYFTAVFENTAPLFDHYEYRIDSKAWVNAYGKEVLWKVTKSKSRFEVRAVNSLGRAGSPTFIELNYE